MKSSLKLGWKPNNLDPNRKQREVSLSMHPFVYVKLKQDSRDVRLRSKRRTTEIYYVHPYNVIRNFSARKTSHGLENMVIDAKRLGISIYAVTFHWKTAEDA